MLEAVDIEVLIEVAHVHVVPVLPSSSWRYRSSPVSCCGRAWTVRQRLQRQWWWLPSTLEVEHEAADHETRDDIRERGVDEFDRFLINGDVSVIFCMMHER